MVHRPDTPETHSILSQFRRILTANNNVIEVMGNLEQAIGGEYIFDKSFLATGVKELITLVRQIINNINILSDQQFISLWEPFTTISNRITEIVGGGSGTFDRYLALPFHLIHRDLDYLVGSENAALGEIRNELNLKAPDGFAITTSGYRLFISHPDCRETINKIVRNASSTEEKATTIRSYIESIPFPQQLLDEIETELNRLRNRSAHSEKLVVKISDTETESPRQPDSHPQFILNIRSDLEDVIRAYRKLVALHCCTQWPDPDSNSEPGSIAVTVQETIPSEIGGTIHTQDPEHPENQHLLIGAEIRNQNNHSEKADSYLINRLRQFKVVQSSIRPDPAASLQKETAIESGKLLRGSALLTPGQIRQLTDSALLLEKAFYQPQEIEWMINNRTVVITKSRSLQMVVNDPPTHEELQAELKQAEILFQDRGQVVQLGICSGAVVHTSPDISAEDFPAGAIAVSHWSGPELSPIVKKAGAVITDVGSPVGHLATIAREYNTPALFGTEIATATLQEGETITIDVETRTVYRGVLKNLIRQRPAEADILHQSTELKQLRRILRWIAPLNLTDPRSEQFQPENCRTFHDIVRFCHEKAVSTIINLHGQFAKRFKPIKYELSGNLPFEMKIIDLGKGIIGKAAKKISLQQINSDPFKAILSGLTHQAVWSSDAVTFGLKDLVSSLSKPVSWMFDAPEYQGENLALIARDYCNLSLRLGYHFNVIDSFLSGNSENNYIYFRFVGGFSEKEKRERRVDFINLVLTSLRFKTERKGDLIIGKMKMIKPEEMIVILKRLGELAAFSRQLDVQMRSDEEVDMLFSEFLDKSAMHQTQD